MRSRKHDNGPVQIWILRHHDPVPCPDLSVKGSTCYANPYSYPKISAQSAPYRGKDYEPDARTRTTRTRTRK